MLAYFIVKLNECILIYKVYKKLKAFYPHGTNAWKHGIVSLRRHISTSSQGVPSIKFLATRWEYWRSVLTAAGTQFKTQVPKQRKCWQGV